MKKRQFLVWLSLFLICAASVAWAQQHTDIALESVVPLYPGSRLQFEGTDSDHPRAVLTTDDDMDAVVIYLRKVLATQGWELASGMNIRHGVDLTYMKGVHILHLSAARTPRNDTQVVFRMNW